MGHYFNTIMVEGIAVAVGLAVLSCGWAPACSYRKTPSGSPRRASGRLPGGRCQTGCQKLVYGHLQEAHVTTPPDFGGREIEEGVLEDLGGSRQEHGVDHEDENAPMWSDNEAQAPGKVCELCGAVITPGQDVRRRADGQWMHEICP
jgi:hypothetical protein